ncbi:MULTISPECIES: glycosyltransferase [unclassified Pseudomonas]|uniref:glycosyltransferase n=1 Tax=unclassified Pseudomonas TaxID=196821 RepID=UPI0018E6ACF4|nr:glycosyltransferase [Pseudomonas sp. CCOS 191]MBI6954775.1 glycosyltransferase [Pseudomonas sp. CCOS 191]
MNETTLGSRDEVTVVLLGHEQADHRARAAHYYQRAGVPCQGLTPAAVVDAAALGELLAQVATPFVCLALDADFVLGAALDNAVRYLRAQPEVMAVQGHALAYAPGNSQLTYHKVGEAFAAHPGESVLDRLRHYADAEQQAWRAVIRTQALRAALVSLPEGLDAAGWRVALSCAILLLGAVAHLEQTDVICESQPEKLSSAVREERMVQTVRALRQWGGGHDASVLSADDGFEALNRFVRKTWCQGEQPLLFTSRWTSVIDDPARSFEPEQHVELPYYNRPLFDRLTEVEFLCHAWPTGKRHRHALEGAWVRQRDLLVTHPNDTRESLQERYWKALGLGLFNVQVCRSLNQVLTGEDNTHHAREMGDWMARLLGVPDSETRHSLLDTPSGQVLAAIDAATPDEAARKRVLAHLAKHPAPQIAFVVLDLNNDDLALQATFDSLLASGVRNFKLVVLKAGKPPAITTARDTLHFIQVAEGNWVSHLNQLVRQLPSEWLLLLEAGDVLLAGGLMRLAVELAQAPACHAIAADEVQRDSDGRLFAVRRPGSDLDLLRSQPGLMARHWLVRRQAVLDLDGYNGTDPQTLDYDLLLRLVEHHGAASLAHMDDYLVVSQQPSSASIEEARKILNRHLTQLGYRPQISEQGAGGLAIEFRHSATPLVSIVLAGEVEPAWLAGIFQRTRYPRYEVVLALPGQPSAAQVEAFQALGGRLRVVTGEVGATHRQLLGLAAGEARGDYLVLLSPHCQVITPAWIESLLNEAQRPEVGVVGASLWAADGTLAHAGYQLLAGPRVHAPWRQLSLEGAAKARWPLSVRSCSAVSDGCLMVDREAFVHCGGLPLAGDIGVGLSLMVAQAGLMVVWTPRAQLLATDLPVLGDEASSQLAAHWPEAFQGDGQLDSLGAGEASPSSNWIAQLG